ncbi:hypothetical protein E2C01_062606 [Portunus trituberculatus]|uniref:Uncharacterized protein n=1 Tax=Portunus trituberculatus TaxID=210409 RepID=A0A5B7HEH4_PORTR|nr:hypothetical protein [Portunus trituberculatus]
MEGQCVPGIQCRSGSWSGWCPGLPAGCAIPPAQPWGGLGGGVAPTGGRHAFVLVAIIVVINKCKPQRPQSSGHTSAKLFPPGRSGYLRPRLARAGPPPPPPPGHAW